MARTSTRGKVGMNSAFSDQQLDSPRTSEADGSTQQATPLATNPLNESFVAPREINYATSHGLANSGVTSQMPVQRIQGPGRADLPYPC